MPSHMETQRDDLDTSDDSQVIAVGRCPFHDVENPESHTLRML